MIPIPGIVIAVLTFPGVVVHEVAHQLFCRLSRVAVLEVVYFRVGNPAGYILHEAPRRFWQHLLIGVGPFLVNTLVGAAIAFPAIIPIRQFESGSALHLLLAWLGVSIAMHAFPSTGDAKSMWAAVASSGSWVLQVITAPIVLLIFLGALGSVVWLDLVYGILVTMWLPTLLIQSLA